MNHLLFDYDAFTSDLIKYSHSDLKKSKQENSCKDIMSGKELNQLVTFMNETDVSKLEKYSYKQIGKWIMQLCDESSNFGNLSVMDAVSPLQAMYGKLKNITVLKNSERRRLL